MSENRQDRALLTSAEAAELLGVHESSIKRWSDAGRVETLRTRGGHRRLPLSDVLRLAADEGLPTILDGFGAQSPTVWSALRTWRRKADPSPFATLLYDLLREAHESTVLELFRLWADLDLPVAVLADQILRPALEQIGTAWARGELTVAEEHAASAIVLDGLRLYGMRRALLPDRSPAPGEPPVLVGAAEGQLHEVGAYCARLALTEAGRPVLYLGANVPVADLAATARRTQADVLCISFGPDRTPDDARRELRLLLELLPDADCRIIVGGRGADALQPQHPHITAIATITALPAALEDHH